MEYTIRYGTENQCFDVSSTVIEKCLIDDSYIVIDKCDFKRDKLFGDPALYINKHIWIYRDDNLLYKIDEYHIVFINLKMKEIKELSKDDEVHKEIMNCKMDKVNSILYNTELVFGNFQDSDTLKWTNKYQLYLEYINNEDSVLQIGSNYGRDPIILNKLTNCKCHVIMEYHSDVIPLLEIYNDMYDLSYNIVSGILSLKPTVRKDIFLMRSDIPYTVDELNEFGIMNVECIKLDELEKKYKTTFNVLVFNCVGYFYYILRDFNHMLDNVHTIILDNDILIIEHKKWVKSYLEGKQFKMVNSLDRNLSEFRGNEFYQVWERT